MVSYTGPSTVSSHKQHSQRELFYSQRELFYDQKGKEGVGKKEALVKQ